MALKSIINDLGEVPPPMRDHYKMTADGKFSLTLDGEPPGFVRAERLSEFRTNNRTLHTANTELEARLRAFDGIDPAAYQAMKERLAAFEDLDLSKLAEKSAADVAAAVDAAKVELTAHHAAEQSRLAAELAAEKAAHAATQFKNIISAEFVRAGGRGSAVDYMVSEAAKTFTVKDGQIATDEFSAVNPGEPLTVSEWMQTQIAVADFAFLPSRGGGAGPHTQGGPAVPQRRTVSRDPEEFGRNIVGIANGDITVV